MNRLRLAAIFGTLSLSIYFLVVVVSTMFAGQSIFLHVLTAPLSLLPNLVNPGQLYLVRDLFVVSSMWLAFVCIVDLSVIFSSIKFEDFMRAYAAVNSYAERLLIGLHIHEAKRHARS